MPEKVPLNHFYEGLLESIHTADKRLLSHSGNYALSVRVKGIERKGNCRRSSPGEGT